MTNSPFSENEKAWIEFLRLISNGTDPTPTLRCVQLLRRVVAKKRIT